MPSAEADLLRARARRLRRVGAQLAARPLDAVLRRAGDDTWRGPLADRWRSEIAVAQHRLIAAGDELVRQAVVLERRADELELLARRVAP
ncbi:MAG: hypothetical protein ACK5CE_09810 [Actinomycetes bacterium]